MSNGRTSRRLLLTGGIAVVLGGTVYAVDRYRPYGIDLSHPLGTRPTAAASSARKPGTALATVTRRTLSERAGFDGTLGYAGSYEVVNQARGVVTWLPSVGRVVRRGQILYRVDGRPVVLLYGTSPAYRALAAGADASDVSGTDVQQLNANLVALGYSKRLSPRSDEFGWRTKQAVKDLQDDLGVDDTGTLELGDVAFLPGALRVTSVMAKLGSPAGGTILKASATRRQVTVKLETTQQSRLKVGDGVTIALPSGKSTPGKVTSVGRVASTPASDQDRPKIDVLITPTRPADAGSLDQAPVSVGVVTNEARDALVVPVESLLALASGGYAVEVVPASGAHRLVAVTLGLFDDEAGVVQVTDTELRAGQRVVVPST
ncbi:efflux RND transporter periplasmic adaptor subunit [Flindersiella endophytica]